MSERRCQWDAATRTPLSRPAREAFLGAIDAGWADPARLYREARQARLLLDASRESLAASLGARPDEIRFTRSANAAREQALTGLVTGRAVTGSLVVSSIEHSSVQAAAASTGLPVHEAAVDGAAHCDVESLLHLAEGSVAVALQAANGEVGTCQPIAELGGILSQRGIPLACDATALAGHAPTPSGWSTLAVAPENFGGPGGIGVVAVRTGVRWRSPEITNDPVWVPLAASAAIALETSLVEARAQGQRLSDLVDRIRTGVTEGIEDVYAVGDPIERLPHIVTLACMYVDGETLVRELDARGYAVASGSACVSDSLRPSHVLTAMGALTHGNLRLSLPWDVTADEVERFICVLPAVVAEARGRLGA